jgi:diguanylate cyclase (GGDEF)-like protein
MWCKEEGMFSQRLIKGIGLVTTAMLFIGGLILMLEVFAYPTLYYFQVFLAISMTLLAVLAGYMFARRPGIDVAGRNPPELTEKIVQSVCNAFSGARDGYCLVDNMGLIQSTNRAVSTIFNESESKLLDCDFRRILANSGVTQQCLTKVGVAFESALEGESTTMDLELYIQPLHLGSRLEISLTPLICGHRGEEQGGRVMISLHEKASVMGSEMSDESLESCLDAIGLPVMIIDCSRSQLRLRFANAEFVRFSGESAKNLFVQEPLLTLETLINGADMAMLSSAIIEKSPISLLTTKRDVPEAPRQDYRVSLSHIYGRPGQVIYQVVTFSDVTEELSQANQLAFRHSLDSLTGLPGREAFQGLLVQKFQQGFSSESGSLALLYIDLDEFKPVNDILGYAVGDKLLISVARRLQRIVNAENMLARLCGDEFVILMTEFGGGSDACNLAERILVELARPHNIHGNELSLTASIGIAVLEPGNAAPETLLQKADMSMLRAKQRGRNTYDVFDSSIAKQLERRVQMRNELQEAIDTDGLELHYQSIVDASGGLCGFEALMRWQHKQRGSVPPSEFITLAEETGQIAQLTSWSLRQACLDAMLLVESGILTGRMSVNISSTQFHRFNFLDLVRGILEETGLDPMYLELELTETVLMQDISAARELIEELIEMGVTTAIDDFGTGFSSLSYLSTLPVKKIKIDQSFVKHVVMDLKEASVCKGVISLAQRLDMEVVAEGVETESQYSCLRRQGCDYFQGFLFSRPEALDHLIKDYQLHGVVSRNLLQAASHK